MKIRRGQIVLKMYFRRKIYNWKKNKNCKTLSNIKIVQIKDTCILKIQCKINFVKLGYISILKFFAEFPWYLVWVNDSYKCFNVLILPKNCNMKKIRKAEKT